MAGAALDQHVAGAHHRFAHIHHRDDLAFEHERVIDRRCFVHHRMPSVLRMRARRAEFGKELSRVGTLHLRVGRKIDDAENGAEFRRHQLRRGRRRGARIVIAAIGSGRGEAAPKLGDRLAGPRLGLEDRRRRAVGRDDRAVLCVVSGDDAARRSCHDFSPSRNSGAMPREIMVKRLLASFHGARWAASGQGFDLSAL
ncbi:MAG TPA: hypothetical protein VHY80_04825 [Stellaceae bacterium]|nr:hypothetical protein [Stellaceae bacterium]